MSLATIKKGDTVILHMFTGIAVGVKEVLAADKSTVTLETRVGMAKFSRKSGKQIEPKAKNERFANYITEDDGSYVPTTRSAKPKKKAKPAKAAEPDEPDYDDEDEEEEPAPKKKAVKKTAPAPKKSAPAKSKKKSKPEPDEDEDIDEDEYEEED